MHATDSLAEALHGGQVPTDELSATRALAALPESALAERLESANLTGGLAKALHPMLQKLVAEKTSTELHVVHGKYLQDKNAFELVYADLSVFFGGLEKQIGPPEAHVKAAMEREHTAAADSLDEFTTGNYGVTTTPQIEWWFVVEPERGIAWPVEAKLVGSPEKMRKPMPVKELEAALARGNSQMRSLGEPLLLVEEVFGARLYTGPTCARLELTHTHTCHYPLRHSLVFSSLPNTPTRPPCPLAQLCQVQ